MNNKPLRVLHVLAELKPSGAEAMLVTAAPYFQAEGVTLEVLSTGNSVGPYANRFQDAGYRVHHIPFSRTPRFFLKVRYLMKTGQYDIIHLHVEAANFWYGLTARSVNPQLVLRTVHNVFLVKGNLRWRRGIQRRLLHWLGLRHVSIGTSVRDTEFDCYRLPTTLIWNWYNSTRFVATSLEERAAARGGFGLADTDFVIASVGNCSQVKNHTAIIEAMAMLPAGQRPVYLHAGIEQANEPERALARKLGVAEHIRFLGAVGDVLPLLRASDAYVMPSMVEGFSIAALEALATGLPALFSDVPGLRDLRSNLPHLIYTGTSAEQVAGGLQKLIVMPETQKAFIRSHYPAITQRLFGLERGVQEYLTLYRGDSLPRTAVASGEIRA